MKENSLPNGWIEVELHQVAADTNYPIGDGDHGQIKPFMYKDKGIPYIRVSDMGWGNFKPDNLVFIDKETHERNLKSELKPGDVLIAKTGATIGKCCIVPNEVESANTTSSVGKVTLDNRLMNPKWLLNYFLSREFRDFMWSISERTAQPGFNIRDLVKFKIPLPPKQEHDRIVVKLDVIMQKVESNKQRLEKIPKLLKRFRQSVLAAAVSGDLTAGWRSENKNIESATSLLERIKKERIERYEVECQKAKKENKRKPTKRFLDVVPSVDYGFATDIPESWAITNIDYLAWVTKLAGFEYTKYIKFSSVGEVPVIRAQNVQMGEFVDDNIIYIDKKTSDFLERSQLFGREILMVFIGEGTGNVCLCPSDKRWHLAPNVAKIDVDGISNHYLNYYLQSPIGLRNTLSFMKATAQPSLSMETIRQVAVQLPPLEEQKEIVKQIEKLFAFADKLEARYTKAKIVIDKLPQSILAKAFRGELVAQDPSDEPASVLLERIKKEKEKFLAEKKGKRFKEYVIEEKPLKITADKNGKIKKAKV